MGRHAFILLAGLVYLVSSSSFAESQSTHKQFTGDDWLRLTKRQRVETVTSFIQSARAKGIVIKKAPLFYGQQLDAFYEEHPSLSSEPVAVVLKTIMIMEYDWAVKGLDKDALARKWLGEELYKKNKARLPAKQI